MKKKKFKIIFLINTVTSYQLDFFNELKKYCNLKVIFYSKNYENYNFSFKKNKMFFFLDNEKDKEKKILNVIKKIKPDFTIIGGYRLPYINGVIKLLKQIGKSHYFWLEGLDNEKLLKYKIVKYLITKKINRSSGVFAVGEQARKFYRKINSNVINLPYSINVNNFNKKNFFKNNKINFMFVGQLIKRKGIDLIIDSFNKLTEEEKKQISLKIIGNGNLKKEVHRFVKNNRFAKYYNFLNKKKIIPLYNTSDIFLFPSRFDGWGVAPMEAMAASQALIISKKVGMSELLKNKKNASIIDLSKLSMLSTIKKYIKQKKNIKIQGIKNRKLILNSLCNVNILSKYLIQKLRKINL